jgi:hypothetical protein
MPGSHPLTLALLGFLVRTLRHMPTALLHHTSHKVLRIRRHIPLMKAATTSRTRCGPPPCTSSVISTNTKLGSSRLSPGHEQFCCSRKLRYSDSGASSHMSFSSTILSSCTPSPFSSTTLGDGSSIPIHCVGQAHLPSQTKPFLLRDILVAPTLIRDLNYWLLNSLWPVLTQTRSKVTCGDHL